MATRFPGDREKALPAFLVERGRDCDARKVTPSGKKIALYLIESYQRSGGGTKHFNTDCNFVPSCSEYAKQAIDTLGLWRALPVIFGRLRRCNDPDKVTKEPDPFIGSGNV